MKTLARGVIASRATRRSADCLCAQEQTLSMRRCMRPGRGHSDLYQEELLHLSWHGRSGGLRLLPVAATSTHGHEDMTLQRIGNHAPVTPEMRTGCVCHEPRDTQLLNGRIRSADSFTLMVPPEKSIPSVRYVSPFWRLRRMSHDHSIGLFRLSRNVTMSHSRSSTSRLPRRLPHNLPMFPDPRRPAFVNSQPHRGHARAHIRPSSSLYRVSYNEKLCSIVLSRFDRVGGRGKVTRRYLRVASLSLASQVCLLHPLSVQLLPDPLYHLPLPWY